MKAACVQNRVICVTLCVIFFRGRIEGRRCAVWSGEREDARGEARGRCFGEGRVPGEREGVALEVGMGRGRGADQMGARRGTRPDSSRYVCASCALCKFASERARAVYRLCEFFVYIPLQKRNSHDRVSGCPITATRHWTFSFTTPFTTCVLLTLVLASRYMCARTAPRARAEARSAHLRAHSA